MQYLSESYTKPCKGLVTKAKATSIVATLGKELPQTGQTVKVSQYVDLTKVRNKNGGPIKHRYVLVGTKPAIENFMATYKS